MVRVEVRTDEQILTTVNSALAPPATEGSACPDILFCKNQTSLLDVGKSSEMAAGWMWDVGESSSGISSAKRHNVINQLSGL